MRRRSVSLSLVLVAALVGVLAPPAVAGGKDGTADNFTCRASALRVTSPLVNSEPIVANRANDPCRDEFAQAANVTVGTIARADLVNARTDVEPDTATADSSVTTATFRVGDTIVTATLLASEANVVCDPKAGQPEFSGSSTIVGLTINGRPVNVTGQPNQTINASPLVVVVINEQIGTADSFTVRALRISSPLLATNVVVAESIVDVNGNPCQAPPEK